MLNFNSKSQVLEEPYLLKIAKNDNFIQSDDHVNKTSHCPIIATFCLLLTYFSVSFPIRLYVGAQPRVCDVVYSFPFRKIKNLATKSKYTHLESKYLHATYIEFKK